MKNRLKFERGRKAITSTFSQQNRKYVAQNNYEKIRQVSIYSIKGSAHRQTAIDDIEIRTLRSRNAKKTYSGND